MMGSTNLPYSSKIIKAGALLADTKTLLANWHEALSVSENLGRFRRDNVFGKASRSRVEDILAIFRQRYLTAEPVTKALVALVKGQFPAEGLNRILYFHAAQADPLLHDVVTEVLARFSSQGRTDVSVEDIQAAVTHWVDEGKTTSSVALPTSTSNPTSTTVWFSTSPPCGNWFRGGKPSSTGRSFWLANMSGPLSVSSSGIRG